MAGSPENDATEIKNIGTALTTLSNKRCVTGFASVLDFSFDDTENP